MNADASVGWSFICLFPLILLAVLGLLVGGGVLVVLAARRLPTPIRPALMFLAPVVLVVMGIVGTLFFAREDTPPILTAAPLLGSIVVAAVVTIGLSRWAFPQWWGARPEVPSQPPKWWSRFLLVLAIASLGIGVLGVLLAVRSGDAEREWGFITLLPLAVGGLLLWVSLPKAPTPRPTGQPPVSFWRFVFSKSGALIFLGGVAVAVVVAVVTQKHDLAKLCGSAFHIGVVWWRWSRLKAAARQSGNSPAVAPFLLTPDPTQHRGDCPTCLYPIPTHSPHGLCPRCLIRGAMPSPSSTRLRRGVSPIEPPTAAEVNEFFPHLEVLELIGAGGMGAVYTARQPALDRVVALKIVQSPRGDDDPVFAERFAREARAMAKLDHPNIVTIHESGEAGGLPFLLMEYVDGVTLREAMANRLLTTVEALAVIPQVCDALDFAHRAGVVHRDIKPENILIDQTGRVKIADFGLAKLADPKNVTLTRTQQAMGTPHYMAPEQWERPNDVDHRADVYAVGVVLYELLTGELPLGRFALPSEKGQGDARLDEVVIRALAKDPGQRFQTAGQIKAALSGVNLAAFTPAVQPRRKGFEFRSKRTFLGLPLVHVVAGSDPVTGRKRVAKGWIAIGDVAAFGGVAVGGVTGVGVVGVGGVAGCGLFAIGGALAMGVALAIGGNAAGVLFALGGNAVSLGLSIGGLAAGKFAIGGEAAGEHVMSGRTQTPGFWDAFWAWKRSFWTW